jgi:lipoic acid synthetase
MIDIRQSAPAQVRKRLPPWLKKSLAYSGKSDAVEAVLSAASLHTVCREAKCPNRSECFARGTATFLVMGRICTRSCRFCGVTHGCPQPIDKDEPGRVCEAVAAMGITHVVITSVTRDDLPDGGAGHFAEIIRQLRKRLPEVTVEVLVPDFRGSGDSLDMVLAAGPHVFNHNIETVVRLYPAVRPQASYPQSLEILAKAARFGVELRIKSGLMVGLGETQEEVLETLHNLRGSGCHLVTIGQYLQPSKEQLPVVEYVNPDRFAFYRERALAMGFSDAQAGPFVRSSFMAETMVKEKQTSTIDHDRGLLKKGVA